MNDSARKPAAANERVLDLRGVLEDLRRDGYILPADVDRIAGTTRTREQASLHVLNFIADQNLANAKKPGKHLDIEMLVEWLAHKAKQPYYRIDPLKIDVAACTEVMSFAFAKRHKILAVAVTPDDVTIATSEPYSSAWETNIAHVTRRRIKRVVANPAEIQRYSVEFYTLHKSIAGATSGKKSALGGVTNLEAMLELGAIKDPDANDQHIVNIVDWLLQYAYDQRASDIHIEPRRELGHVRFRIDGVLHNVYEMPQQVITAVVSRIKAMGRMNVAEKRRPQDGRLKTRRPDGDEVELRLSTLPTAFGEKLVMRIFDPEVLLRSFSELGLANEDYARWNSMTSRPDGIVLVTGPTGSGKTTTLYSTLKALATADVNVCTIEDPIEMVEDSFNQMQVQHNIELDFAAGVRALLRQDPDIIMIGEIRDRETADMAIQAALTGHLVLSTLHTNDAPSALTRLLEIGVPGYLMRATLLGVMAQRLVRTLCPHCKEKVTIDERGWSQLTHPFKIPPPPHTYKVVGCLECRNTGYLGRQGIYEILQMTPPVQALITDTASIDELRRQGMKEGMRTLRLSGAQKVAAGDTTIEEVMRVAPVPHGR
jgi:general secretion pathway protein E